MRHVVWTLALSATLAGVGAAAGQPCSPPGCVATPLPARCRPTVTTLHPGELGTNGFYAFDGNGISSFDTALDGAAQRLDIDFGCSGTLLRVRRAMASGGKAERGAKSELFSVRVAGRDVPLANQITTGWETWAGAGGFSNLPYGWTPWLLLDSPARTSRIAFAWDDAGDELAEIEIGFSADQPPPGPDLWVTKSDGRESYCLEDTPSDPCSVAVSNYTIRLGNRGTRVASGVVLTDELPFGTLALLEGWQCSGWSCERAEADLAPGEAREVGFEAQMEASVVRRDGGAFNSARIADDRSHGADRDPRDNHAGDETTLAACQDPFSNVACCALRFLWGFAATSAPPAAQAVAGIRRLVAPTFDTVEDLHLFYRVRETLLRSTPGGRRAIELYDAHTGEITRHLATSAALRAQALDVLDLWKAPLAELLAGRGSTLTISQLHVDSIRSFLDALGAVASPALRDTLEREAAAIDLETFPGKTLDQGLARLNRLSCGESEEALCLGGGRFRVDSTWQTASAAGSGHAVALTSDTGTFWFFDPANVEVIVKVLDGCGVNQRRWVFAAGLTDVRVVLTVTDTQTGAVRTYVNHQGRPFQPVQDTNAFSSCS